MLDERFMQDIPESLGLFKTEVDDETQQTYQDLRRDVAVMQARRQQLADEYGILLPLVTPDTLAVRLNLLILHGFGSESVERFRFELDWTRALTKNIELVMSNASAQRRAQTLHMPDGRTRLVVPEEDDGE